MCSEFHLKALPVESKLWSFSITVQLWNIHKEHISNVNNRIKFGGEKQLGNLNACDDHTHLTALQPICLYQHIQTQGLENHTVPEHKTRDIKLLYDLTNYHQTLKNDQFNQIPQRTDSK